MCIRDRRCWLGGSQPLRWWWKFDGRNNTSSVHISGPIFASFTSARFCTRKAIHTTRSVADVGTHELIQQQQQQHYSHTEQNECWISSETTVADFTCSIFACHVLFLNCQPSSVKALNGSQSFHPNQEICTDLNLCQFTDWLRRDGILHCVCWLTSLASALYCLLILNGITHTRTIILRPFFRDHPGEPVPEENFWTSWCKGRLTEADILTIRLGATPSGLTSARLHHPPYFFTGRMPFLPTNQQCQSTEANINIKWHCQYNYVFH